MNNHTIGQIIRKRRKELKINQLDLAQLAGVGINTLYPIESGNGNPGIDILERILDVLGLQIKIVVKENSTD